MTCVAVIPLAIMAFATVARFQQTLETDASKLGRQIAATAAAEIRTFMVAQIRVLDNIAVLYHPQFPIEPEVADRLLENILLSSENFTDIAVVDETGAEIARKNRLIIIGRSDLHGAEESTRLDVVRRSGVYVGPVYVVGGRSYFDLGRQIIALDGSFAGAVFAQVDARVMTSVVASVAKEEDGRVFIVNEEGTVIGYPDISYVLGARDLSALPSVSRIIETKEPLAETYRNELGAEVLGSAYPMTIELFEATTRIGTSINWFVIAEQPVSEVYRDARGAALFAVLVLLAVAALAAATAVFFAGRISRPIVSLHTAAARFAKGELSYRAAVTTGDEIGELAKGFNTMANTIGETLASLTEQKRIVSAERDKLGHILSGVTNAVIAIDAKRRVVMFNTAAEELTGTTMADALGKPLDSVISLFDGESPLSAEEISQSGGAGEGSVFAKRDARLVGAAGERFVNIVSGRIRDGASIDLDCIVTIEDVTKEYAVEKTKREFVSIAAHQLRTPLTGMRWTLEALMSDGYEALADVQKKTIAQAKDAVDRMMNLVNGLLNVTRIDEGHLDIQRSVQSISPVLERAETFFREAAQKKGVAFKWEAQSELPLMNVDAEKIDIVITNIVDNAIRYTPAGGTVSVAVKIVGKDLLFSVADSGIGITEADGARLFTKFFRSPEALVHHTDGSGLGLYVAKNIVERHKGKIWFESEPGKGATFFVSLPLE